MAKRSNEHSRKSATPRGEDPKLPLAEHLRELRHRILLVVVGLVIGACATWLAYDWVFAQLQRPLEVAATEREALTQLNFSTVLASFDMKIKVSVFGGVIITAPWWIFQMWAFIHPGLTRKERRFTVVYLSAATALFLSGAACAWVLLPYAMTAMTSFTPANSTNLIDAQAYLTFVMRLMTAFGIAFLLPVLMVALNAAGLFPARKWLAGWRWAILLASVFGAVATPTGDVVTMLVLVCPIVTLYFGATGICVLHDRRTGAWLTSQGQTARKRRRNRSQP
jgi:sec-independent protein translocase protein TatC